ncbi:dihydrodipicolinate synthase family protein [Aminobacter anthyllidis]|uniref:Dihydrodipicolinate synthase family protein n=1 Tax=Aminobacter anthyllidis TaxID=1035067 RepID=A0A9X1AEN2_9HYPH|nr:MULTISPECIES: dihydrodipicolinate synthase family protein [Phyllobacteriaceae]MBT1158499.1 dihydrodipicolinate synthase family protein [Aminobacter anthyllidis]
MSAFPITPADRSGRVDVDALRKLVSRLIAAEVDSIGLLGSTGIYVYLTRDERRCAQLYPMTRNCIARRRS